MQTKLSFLTEASDGANIDEVRSGNKAIANTRNIDRILHINLENNSVCFMLSLVSFLDWRDPRLIDTHRAIERYATSHSPLFVRENKHDGTNGFYARDRQFVTGKQTQFIMKIRSFIIASKQHLELVYSGDRSFADDHPDYDIHF